MGQGTSKEFKVGDKVQVIRDLSAARELQKGHGGWNDDMEKCLGKVGTVKHIHMSGDIVILVEEKVWRLNPLCLTSTVEGRGDTEARGGGGDLDLLRLLVMAAAAAAASSGSETSTVATCRKFNPGDKVCVLDDVQIVRRLQSGHGGWAEPMSKSIGQTGKVVSVDSDGDVKIEVSGGSWTYNPLCLIPANKEKFNPGDVVHVLNDADLVQHLQKGHGDWVDSMSTSIGQTGNVLFVDEDGDVKVSVSGDTWTFNPLCLAKKDSPQKFNPGDMVRVLDDANKVRRLQEGHGGWVDDMAKSMGQTGKVLRVDKDGDVAVIFRSDMWAFNPLCLTPVNKDSASKEEMTLDMASKARKLLKSAISGEADEVRKLLQSNPELVNVQISNKSALHCAVAKNDVNVLKVILEFKPNLEIKDEDGDTPLHLTAQRDNEEIVEPLLYAGANVNAKNNRDITPLMIAVAKGHKKVAKLLLKRPNIDPQQQDADGDTALHFAVLKDKPECISTLLEGGAIPTTRNEKGFTAMHLAARKGSTSVVEMFIKLTPQFINNKKDDGYTMLHLAALNGNIYVVNVLAASEHCDLNVKNAREQTALHVALIAGHLVVAEQLVGYGADINAVDKDGDTPLHYAFVLPKMAAPSNDTPQLLKIKDKLQSQSKLPSDAETASRIIWACFMTQEGSNMEISNQKGKSFLHLCPNEYADTITQFKGVKSPFCGCLRPKKSNQVANAFSSSKSDGECYDIELKEKLGEGGQGAVYKAVLKSNGKLIAVKKMNIESLATAEKELSALKGIRHKNIIQFYGVTKDRDGSILLLMELAENSLYQAVQKLTPEIRRSINWATQVAQGMRYLHCDAPETILHGDLKSLNVLTFPGDVVKISDFGCAKVFNVTHATSAAISVMWSAPELFDDTQKPNLACDVYSFGILLWEMVTHKVPYDGMGLQSILTKVVKENKRPEIPSTCPEFLSALMKQCWDSDPKKRPTFKAILQVLEDERFKTPTSSPKPSAYQAESTNDIELKEKIGSGASGTVFKAEWKSKNMMVAVKKILVKSAEPIQKEVEIMKSVRHKNIIRFHGYYQDTDENHLIILELADDSLDNVLKTTSPDTKRSLNWATQVARGMSYLHYDAPETILHGDLKSMNVLTFPNDVVKVTDFGSAKYFDRTCSSTANSTCVWTAPELFKKKQRPNLACDVYSYGIVLWEMVTHSVPFSDCDSLVQIITAVTTGERPEIPESCPDILRNLMIKCWDQDPKVRPTFKTVVHTLEEAGEKEFV